MAQHESPEQLASSYHPHDPALPGRFWTTVNTLRTHCPVVHSAAYPGWILTSFDGVFAALRDWETFSSAHGCTLPRPAGAPKVLPDDSDPPDQLEYHRILAKALSPRPVAALEPALQEIADRVIEDVLGASSCDAVAEIASPFTSTAFFRVVVGAPEEGLEKVIGNVQTIVAAETDELVGGAYGELTLWCDEFLSMRRGAPPRDDVVDAILTSKFPSGEPFTEDEQRRLFLNVVFGGLETTVNAIANMCYFLAQRPHEQERLASNLALLPTALEECLRYEPPVINMSRTATRDVDVAGENIRAGEWVLLSYAAANRDPAHFTNPDELDFDRQENRHLSFGAGVHRCVGSNLARLQLRVMIGTILKRMTDLELVPGAPIAYRQAFSRGLRTLPVTYRRR